MSSAPFAAVRLDAPRSLVGLLEGQGYRELASAHIFSAGVAVAPTVDDKIFLADAAREALDHFESLSDLYGDVTGAKLLEVVGRQGVDIPQPRSWLEVAVVQCTFDRAATFQLREDVAATNPLCATLVDRIANDKEILRRAGDETLRELSRQREYAPRPAQALLERWLRLSVQSFARPLRVGQGGRDGDGLVRRFLADLVPVVTECGLRVPPMDAWSSEAPVGAGRP